MSSMLTTHVPDTKGVKLLTGRGTGTRIGGNSLPNFFV